MKALKIEDVIAFRYVDNMIEYLRVNAFNLRRQQARFRRLGVNRS
jgi:hypothetical protein